MNNKKLLQDFLLNTCPNIMCGEICNHWSKKKKRCIHPKRPLIEWIQIKPRRKPKEKPKKIRIIY